MHHDVIIIGAGPAGSTLATLLAQAGYDVLILEKNAFPRYQIGESLLPATVRDLADMLGIREEIDDAGFVTKRGATFSWGKNTDSVWQLNFGGPHSEEPLLSPETPSAYNVTRADFDSLLLNNAVKKGAKLESQCTVLDLISDSNRVTGVRYLNSQGETVTISAHFVADASGQRSKFSRQIGRRTLSKFFFKTGRLELFRQW